VDWGVVIVVLQGPQVLYGEGPYAVERRNKVFRLLTHCESLIGPLCALVGSLIQGDLILLDGK